MKHLESIAKYPNPDGCIACKIFDISDRIDTLYSSAKRGDNPLLIPESEREVPSILAEMLTNILLRRPFVYYIPEREFKRVCDIVHEHNGHPEVRNNGKYIHYRRECEDFDRALEKARKVIESEKWNDFY